MQAVVPMLLMNALGAVRPHPDSGPQACAIDTDLKYPIPIIRTDAANKNGIGLRLACCSSRALPRRLFGKGILFLQNVKRVHPYQRRRTSITGLVL
jgi:hypothetical protein